MERVFVADNGNRITAQDDVQANAFINAGLKEYEPSAKKPKEK